MSLFAVVLARLDEIGIRCSLIGGEALALRGSSRATLDRDLLTTDRRVLDAASWAPLADTSAEVELRCGDDDDPLAGVVRFRAEGERPVDLIVGRYEWQTRILDRSELLDLGEARVHVPRTADLVLLKLFAGGPQDAWDVEQLLADDDREVLIAEVDTRIGDLPADTRRLWGKILDG